MLAHLVHHRRSVLSAPSASAIRYATLHTSRRPTVSSKYFRLLVIRGAIMVVNWIRGTSPIKTGETCPDEDVVSQLLGGFRLCLELCRDANVK